MDILLHDQQITEFSSMGVVACTCNPTTTEAEFWNDVGSIPLEVTGLR